MTVFLFILGILLTCGSFGAIAIFIVGANTPDMLALFIILIGIVVLVGVGFLAHFILKKAKEETNSKGFKITINILSAFTFIQYIIVHGLIWFIMESRKHEWKSTPSSSDGYWELRDENGFTRKLEKTGSTKYINGKQYNIYRDDTGKNWVSDNGKEFYRD